MVAASSASTRAACAPSTAAASGCPVGTTVSASTPTSSDTAASALRSPAGVRGAVRTVVCALRTAATAAVARRWRSARSTVPTAEPRAASASERSAGASGRTPPTTRPAHSVNRCNAGLELGRLVGGGPVGCEDERQRGKAEVDRADRAEVDPRRGIAVVGARADERSAGGEVPREPEHLAQPAVEPRLDCCPGTARRPAGNPGRTVQADEHTVRDDGT
jgi:hypothetical protein